GFQSTGRTVPVRRVSVALETGTRAADWPGGLGSHAGVLAWQVVAVRRCSGRRRGDLRGAPPVPRRFATRALDSASCHPRQGRCSLPPAGRPYLREGRTVLSTRSRLLPAVRPFGFDQSHGAARP